MKMVVLGAAVGAVLVGTVRFLRKLWCMIETTSLFASTSIMAITTGGVTTMPSAVPYA